MIALALLVALAAPASAQPHVVFLVAEDEYLTEQTLPAFARAELEPRGLRASFVFADKGKQHGFSALRTVGPFDLLFVSVRRRAPAADELAMVRAHLAAGRPLVGIRTASHAFAPRGPVPAGHATWPAFDLEALGGRYDGHCDNKDGTPVRLAGAAAVLPVLSGVTPFRSRGTLYRVPELRPGVKVLLRGTAQDKGSQVDHPVAWTHQQGESRVFYTSLGHPGDFEIASFRRLLRNGVLWALGPRAKARQAR